MNSAVSTQNWSNESRWRKLLYAIRRRTLINYRVQLPLLVNTFSIAGLTALQTHLVHLSRTNHTIDLPFAKNIPTIYLVWYLVPIISACVLWGFNLSNKIVGPIFNLQRHLEKFAAGKITGPAKCRKDDFFQELFTAANKVMESVENQPKTPPPKSVEPG